MFIGGLSWQTTPESIREYFSQFGDLAEVMVMKDPATRRSRGFGFITFCEPEAVDKVLGVSHTLDGKVVEPKIAVPRKSNPKFVMRTKKIFVGGLSASTSLEDIKAYFEQFCTVKDAMLAFDKVTHRHRGFGFVTFDNEDVVDKICEIHFHDINGKMVESKKALPKEPRPNFYGGYGHHPFSNPYIHHPQRPGTIPHQGTNYFNRFSMYRPYNGNGGNPSTSDPFLYDNSPRYSDQGGLPRNYNNNHMNGNNGGGGGNGGGSNGEVEYLHHYTNLGNTRNVPSRSMDAAAAAAIYAQNSYRVSPLNNNGIIAAAAAAARSSNNNHNNNLNNQIHVRNNNYYLSLDNYIHNNQENGESYEEDFPELTSKFSQFRFDGQDESNSSSSPNTSAITTINNSNSNNVNNANHYGF
ncbi:MSI [Lepeophtheirus salmonis]|nr:MSI [Lepeophtheirus salmonis]CAF2985149.1 MSI [Lepeophtheirus salmonis]